MLPLQTTGGEGRRWWFLNGEPLMPPAPAHATAGSPDRYQLVVMDERAGGDGEFHPAITANAQLAVCVAKTHLILTKCYLHP
jgi:hypothetical protein